MREGVRLVAEAWPTMDARAWRAFWRGRGMRDLAAVLERSWPPLAAASPHEREACAFRVASLLGSRAPQHALADELARIRADLDAPVPPPPGEDECAAQTIAAWFASAAA